MDINNLMRQAQSLQKQIEDKTNQLNAMEFEGVASNGLVKIVVNGEYKIKSVNIDQSILNPQDKEMIEDLFVIAYNDASNKIEASKKEGLGSFANMLGL